MASWEGASLEDVIVQWGYPDRERKFREDIIYSWEVNQTITLPQQTTATTSFNQFNNTAYTTATTTGGSFNGNCTRELVIENEHVKSWD